jgi:hypothetical protein
VLRDKSARKLSPVLLWSRPVVKVTGVRSITGGASGIGRRRAPICLPRVLSTTVEVPVMDPTELRWYVGMALERRSATIFSPFVPRSTTALFKGDGDRYTDF